jgi:chromosome segregation protein
VQLKSIEIRGFKSFGDKALIHFNSGVTGIVGPNGCGKSNVVDAMRWVLGEQKTRALRSEKMENIIFNGTSKRKPANLAEVSLVFDNNKNILPTEFTEVKITRRLYRTGESEYLLNGVNCRLKDITNLFLDTGIGSDSYAIIELKMIDDILNDKDGSRRELFEEAAGISKYKTRKKETLNKLKDAQIDLDRVDDLLFEIDKNVETLKKQARRTEQFYQLKGEYKTLSLDAAYYTMESFRDTLDKLIEDEQQKADEKLAISAQIKTTEATAEQQKLDLINKEKLLLSRQKATNEFVNEIRRIESEQRLKSETLRMLQEREVGIVQQQEADKTDLRTLKQKSETLQDSYDAESYTVGTAQTAMETDKVRRDTAQSIYTQLKTQYDQAQQQLAQAQQMVFGLEKNIAVNNIQLETIAQELVRSDSEEQNRSKEVNEFGDIVIELKDELEAQQNLMEGYIDHENELQQATERLTKKIDDNRQQLADTNRTLDAKRNELRLTKSLVENMEGYPDALKFLKKNTHNWAKNPQILTDIVTCAPAHKLALSAVLEPYLNYFVVETTAEALHAIGILENEKKGKANFFIAQNYTQYNPTTPPNALINLIDCAPQYLPLMATLLQNVMLIDADSAFENAINIEKNTENQPIFVTISGKLIGNALRLGGGYVGAFEGKRLGQKRNLDQLTIDIETLEIQTNTLKTDQQTIQNDLIQTKNNSKKTIIERCQQKINQLNTEYTKVKTKQEQFENFMATLSNRKTQLKQKQTELTEILQQETAELTEKYRLKTLYENSQNSVLAAFEKAENEFRTTSDTFNQTNIKYLQLSNKLNNIERELGYNDAQIAQIQQRLTTNQTTLSQIKTDMQAQLSKTDLSDDNLLEMYDQKQAMEAAVGEAEQTYYALRGSIDEAEQTTRQLRTKRDNLDEIVTLMKERSSELKLQRASLTERLSVEFEVEPRTFATYLPTNPNGEAAVRKALTQVKTRIDAFGAINPLAIEAYQEATERHQFISEQRNDLLQAKQSLLLTIAEIDQAATERFDVTFATVRDNFQRVFRSLFTQDDTCDLILTNPADVLGSDINIIARPKGKRPLTINQLSGGEKTLTATALLFAIYLYKPAPFCIFDEVDAPLDDNNIDKFNNIIKDFSKESQFIIVTHNKRTMSTTDVMYGITMVEQGVSRVVPVDLSALT